MKSMLFRFSLLLMLALSPALQVQAEDISKQQAIKIAQKSNPGRILAIKRTGKNYRVKILNTHGEVHIILVSANSGKISHK